MDRFKTNLYFKYTIMFSRKTFFFQIPFTSCSCRRGRKSTNRTQSRCYQEAIDATAATVSDGFSFHTYCGLKSIKRIHLSFIPSRSCLRPCFFSQIFISESGLRAIGHKSRFYTSLEPSSLSGLQLRAAERSLVRIIFTLIQ